MKKRWIAAAAALMITAFLAGCGSTAKYDVYEGASESTAYAESYADYDMAAAYEEPYYDAEYADYDYAEKSAPAESLSAEVNTSGAETEQKLIYTADLTVESTEYDTAVASLASLTEELGGYYESSSQGAWSDGSRYMNITVRIPAENYRSFLNRSGELFHVLYRSEYTEDVSEEYYDVAGRLETQQTKLERLQELLSQAEDMEDIIAIENEISNTEEIIDSYTGQLRRYDALVDYSTVYIDLSEVTEETPEEEPGFGARLGEALSGGIRGLVAGLQGILIVLAYIWPWLLIIAAIVVGIVFLNRKLRPRREARRAAKRAKKEAKRAAKQATKNPQATPLDK